MYRPLVEIMPAAVTIADYDGIIRIANAPAAKIHGYDRPGDIIGMRGSDLVAPEDRTEHGEVRRMLRSSPEFRAEALMLRRDGSRFPAEYRISEIRDPDGKPPAYLVIIHDISERIQKDAALRESGERYRRITGAITDYIYTVAFADGRIVSTTHSPACEAVTGYTPEEFDRDPYLWITMVHEDDRDTVRRMTEDILFGRDPSPVVHRIWRRDGSLRWIRNTPVIRRDGDGQVVSYDGIVSDITDHRRSEDALRESEERYRIISELSTDYVFKISVNSDGTLTMTHVSENMHMLTGRTREEVSSSTLWRVIIHPDDWASFVRFQLNLITGGDPGEFECRSFLKDGTVRWIHIYARPMRDPATGAVTSITGAIKDVTDRRAAEERLSESEELYRSVIESSPQGMHFYRLEPDGRLVFTGANPAADNILGVDNSRFIGMTLEEAFPPLAGTELPERYRAVCRTRTVWHGEEIEYRDDRIAGAFFVQAFPIGRDRMVAAFYDITDRKRAEESLMETQRHLEYIIGVTGTGIDIIDADYGLRYVDPEWQKRYGPYEGKKCYEYFMSRDRPCPTCGIPRALETKQVNITEEVLPHEDNRVIEVHTIPFQRAGGEWMVAEFNLDITERKKAEESIRASLAEKETLLKEIHHRVKNNLQIITSLLSLQSRYFSDSELERQFTEAQNRIRTMSLVHENLYQSKDFGHINLRSYITELARDIMASYSTTTGHIGLRMDIEDTEISIDSAIPCGLIINELLTNSIKHAFPAGFSGERKITLRFTRQENGTAELVIGDNGVGIPEGTVPGKTDSLGLSLVPLLAEQLKGTVALDRTGGTTFTVRFRP